MCLQKSDRSRLIELQINAEGQISGLLHEESNPSADIATGLALHERNWYQFWFTVDVENGRVVMGQSRLKPSTSATKLYEFLMNVRCCLRWWKQTNY